MITNPICKQCDVSLTPGVNCYGNMRNICKECYKAKNRLRYKNLDRETLHRYWNTQTLRKAGKREPKLPIIRVCSKCSVQLILHDNWYESSMKHSSYQCKPCVKATALLSYDKRRLTRIDK